MLQKVTGFRLEDAFCSGSEPEACRSRSKRSVLQRTARVLDSRANYFFRGTAFAAATFGFFEVGAGASEVFPAVFALLGASVFGFFEDGVAVGVFGKLGDWAAGFFRDELSTCESC